MGLQLCLYRYRDRRAMEDRLTSAMDERCVPQVAEAEMELMRCRSEGFGLK